MKDSPEYYQAELNTEPFISSTDLVRKRSASNEFGEQAYKLLKRTVNTKKDECEIYGQYIAEKLRKFDQLSRAQAQHKINNALFEIEMEFFKKTRYVEATTSQADTITFDSTLSPFQISPKTEDYEDEDE